MSSWRHAACRTLLFKRAMQMKNQTLIFKTATRKTKKHKLTMTLHLPLRKENAIEFKIYSSAKSSSTDAFLACRSLNASNAQQWTKTEKKILLYYYFFKLTCALFVWKLFSLALGSLFQKSVIQKHEKYAAVRNK